MRLLLQFSLLLLASMGWGSASKIVEGTLELAPEGEAWVLRIGKDAVPVLAERKTRYWAKRASADAKAFKVGDAVVARIVTDESPAALKELSDKESWTWLDGIRKGVRDGTMKAFDGKYLTVSFADGSEMAYRATEKSQVLIDGKAATLGDLKPGQRLWLKGRTLPTLDTWLVTISDRVIVVAPKKTATKKSATGTERPRKLPATGAFKGPIEVHHQGQGMFDMTVDGVRLHVSYLAATAFTFGGVRCGPNELVHGREATVQYHRDQYGRIIAAKVEIR